MSPRRYRSPCQASHAVGCLLSLRLRQPLIFRLAVEILGPGTPKGRDVIAAWRYPGPEPEPEPEPEHRSIARPARSLSPAARPYTLIRCLAR
jgi:hypothetical protein